MTEDTFNLDKRYVAIAEYQREMQAKYRMLFKEEVGREVLGDILSLCGFPGATGEAHNGLDPNNPAEIGRFNVGIDIAKKAGVLKSIGTHILGINSQEV